MLTTSGRRHAPGEGVGGTGTRAVGGHPNARDVGHMGAHLGHMTAAFGVAIEGAVLPVPDRGSRIRWRDPDGPRHRSRGNYDSADNCAMAFARTFAGNGANPIAASWPWALVPKKYVRTIVTVPAASVPATAST